MQNEAIIQLINTFKNNISLYIQRDDLLHSIVSGNKFRKLKYNIQEAVQLQKKTIITFGGAFSNHIAATAFAANEANLCSVGIIRGEELKNQTLNETLLFAQQCGMQFEFVTREEYQKKNEKKFVNNLLNNFQNPYIIPEGGANSLAIKGCEEIVLNHQNKFDYTCVAVGTGTTLTGISNALTNNKKILGFPALKGNFLDDEITKFAINKNWELITDYHFGGYAKTTPQLITFLNDFYKKYKIPLDPIYTGKMMFGLLNLIEKDYFEENTKIIAIHTGGLQGIKGINKNLKNKNLETIHYEY